MTAYAMGAPVPPAEYVARFPNAAAGIGKATKAAQRGAWLDACGHVVDGGPRAFLCVGHPAAGLLCDSCFALHLERHIARPEVCDECEAPYSAGTATDLPLVLAVTDAAVRDAQGRVGAWTGTMSVVGTAVCPACWP